MVCHFAQNLCVELVEVCKKATGLNLERLGDMMVESK